MVSPTKNKLAKELKANRAAARRKRARRKKMRELIEEGCEIFKRNQKQYGKYEKEFMHSSFDKQLTPYCDKTYLALGIAGRAKK